MIAGAIKQYLNAKAVQNVRVAEFGDYTANKVEHVVYAAPGEDFAAMGSVNTYVGTFQVRTRASGVIVAEREAVVVFGLLRGMQDQPLVWAAPEGDGRRYTFNILRPLQRPTWIPSPGAGEVVTVNFSFVVTQS